MRVLWIDQDISLVNALKSGFSPELEIHHLTELTPEGIERMDWGSIHLLLMELQGPRGCQLGMVASIRSKKIDLPVLILTGHANKEDCILALNSGVNGLLEKPATVRQIEEKISALMKLEGELPLNHERKAVFSNGKWIDLTSTEYRILESLKSARRRLTRAELQASVWPGSNISENNLDTHLTNLKKKIPELNQYLNVKRGLGYFLTLRKS
jgi:two-component system phosphate regulon response regulator PhoB